MVGNFWRLTNLEKNKLNIKEDYFRIQNALEELFCIQRQLNVEFNI